MKVLVIGGGGREHTLIWKLKASPLLKKIYCAPGNAGIAREAECVDIPVSDLDGLLKFAIKTRIDLTVVGPEAPLVAGVVDLFEANGMPIYGPTQRAAELEGSKVFCKNLMARHRIPSAKYEVFDDFEAAKGYLARCAPPIVVKADGLAAGKGAIVCETREKALEALNLIMVKRAFGAAGDRVIIEECLTGEEVSVLALCDGETLVTMVPSQDHKRVFDDDQGPNTGGMGAYAPTPLIDDAMMAQVHEQVLVPTVQAMALEDRPYRGVLYAGLMLTAEGPKVLEYNCRFGDPETQVILPLAKTDLLAALLAAREGRLAEIKWVNRGDAAVCVVMASGGYPGAYRKGVPILFPEGSYEENVKVFHAGTRNEGERIVTSGGRVLGVTAMAPDIAAAVKKAYRTVGRITFDGAYYRKDIAARALRHLNR